MTRTSAILKKTALLALVLPFLLPLVSRDDYILHTLIMIAVGSMLGIGVRLVLLSGNMQFAQAGFYGVGAFASAILVMQLGWNTWLSLPVAAAIAAVLALLVGVPSLRVKGPYFAMITMALNEVLRLIFTGWSLTGGVFGIAGVPGLDALPGIQFASKVEFYYFALLLLVLVALVAYWLERSRFGLMLAGIRQAEALAESVGVNVFRYKLAVFLIACAFAGVAGAFYAHYNGFVSAQDFTFHNSAEVVIGVIVGGRWSFFGPMIGVTFLSVVGEAIGGFQHYIPFAYGGILILVLLFRPDGLASLPVLVRTTLARHMPTNPRATREARVDVAS